MAGGVVVDEVKARMYDIAPQPHKLYNCNIIFIAFINYVSYWRCKGITINHIGKL